MEIVEVMINRESVGADELDDAAGCFGSEAFFEIVDAVIFGRLIWEALDAVEVVGFEFMLEGVFNHVPLDEILGVVVLHVLLITTGEKINDLVAVGDEHGRGERDIVCFGDEELHLAFGVEEVVHLLIIAQWTVSKVAAVTGGFGDLLENI